MDLALNNLERLIYHKIQTQKTNKLLKIQLTVLKTNILYIFKHYYLV